MVLTEEQRKYQREWRRKNYERIKAKQTPEQIEKRRQYEKEYREKNKEKIKEKMRIRNQSPEEKKKKKIREWKHRGLISDDYDAIYDKWKNTTHCEDCNIVLEDSGVLGGNQYNTRCMDHCHISGEFRGIVCHPCNMKRK